jgi:hypothetical protein
MRGEIIGYDISYSIGSGAEVGRIGRKRKLRTLIFYFSVAFVLMVALIYRTYIWLALIGVLNALAETFDSLAGR